MCHVISQPTKVVEICKKLANDIAQGKQDTDAVLAEVAENNEESKSLIGRMDASQSQKCNRRIPDPEVTV